MTLGEKLRQARLDRGLSQSQVAGDHMTRNMLSQLEHDQASPSVGTLMYLAQKLEVSVAWLLVDDPQQTAERYTAQAREAFARGDYTECMDLLAAQETLTEEAVLLLCRSAVAAGTQALETGLLQDAERAAEFAASCEGVYLCEYDRTAVCGLQMRIALMKGNIDPCLTRWKKACQTQLEYIPAVLMEAHALILSGSCLQAEQLMQNTCPRSSFEEGYCALLHGWIAAEKQEYDAAIDHLRLVEDHPTIGRSFRMEAYRLLEVCFREKQDFRQAYRYAVLRMGEG